MSGSFGFRRGYHMVLVVETQVQKWFVGVESPLLKCIIVFQLMWMTACSLNEKIRQRKMEQRKNVVCVLRK